MKNSDKVTQNAARICLELKNCLQDGDNGSSLIDNENYEQDVKDFLQGLNLATGLLLSELTGNQGDVIDTLAMMTRIAFEYSDHED